MLDEQIAQSIAKSIDKMRRVNGLTTEKMAMNGGFNPQTFSNFLNQGSNIKLSTLLQFLRGVGEIDKLEHVFEDKTLFSPTGQAVKIPKKIYASKAKDKKSNPHVKKIVWGDEA
jgi:hypothetical protein